jgi:hypothetical protein
MLALWIVARIAGVVGVDPLDSWRDALRLGLAGMFLFTAASHFHPRTRPDLIRMVPPELPQASMLVSLTGIFEGLGAFGLLLHQTQASAAFGLALLSRWQDGRPCRWRGGCRCRCFGSAPSCGLHPIGSSPCGRSAIGARR